MQLITNSTILSLLVALCVGGNSFAGQLNDYNPWDVSIPDNCSGVSSDLSLTEAPSDAEITEVDLYFEIQHSRHSDLTIWLTTYYSGGWHDYMIYEQGALSSNGLLNVSRNNLHLWDGASANQTWYLSARDCVSGYTGYISFFELWVTYETNEAPNTPSNPDPNDGESGVSRTTNLDWSCSDPNGDVTYYTVYFEKNDSSPDNVIKNDATGSYADPGTLDHGSHYYWRVKVDDHKGGVTLGPVWDFQTEEALIVHAEITNVSFNKTEVVPGEETITATVTVRNTGNQTWTFWVGGSSIEGGDDTWYDWSPPRPSVNLSPGYSNTVQLSWCPGIGVPVGTYGFYSKVFKYSTGDEYVDEDWRGSAFDVVAPIVDVEITNVSFNKTEVVPGKETITATVTVRNTGNQTWTFWVGGSSIEGGDDTWYDWSPPRASVNLSPGYSNTVQLSWSPEIGLPVGTYGFYSKVFKYSTGDKYVDENWYEGVFQVVELDIVLEGRVLYHSYSDYIASAVDATDGNVFIYSFSSETVKKITGQLCVENSMNAHFAPDGSRFVFMAIPQGAPGNRASLEIYIYDLADETLTRLTSNSIPDEDPKFSPDGRMIVFKRSNQIWVMNSDGSNMLQLTATQDEKSGPNYSPDGSRIVYWSSSGSNADIWWMFSNGTGASKIVGTANLQEYYPIFRSIESILYTRWESTSDHHDKIYEYSVSTGTSERLPINVIGVEDSDPFPINSSLIGYSSQREGGKGGWDVVVGDATYGTVYRLPIMNSPLHDLGGSYSQYRFARKIVLVTPAVGGSFESGSNLLLKVHAFSDGDVWSGASPTVVFNGPSPISFSNLRDDGISGDEVGGDGIYSKVITVPGSLGDYTVWATAISSDNGLQNSLESVPVMVYVVDDAVDVHEIESPQQPSNYSLQQNYPNPFNLETRIEFFTPRQSFVTMDILDILGDRIRILVNEPFSAGYKVVTWDAKNDSGLEVSSGIYFYRIMVGEFVETKKMVLLR